MQCAFKKRQVLGFKLARSCLEMKKIRKHFETRNKKNLYLKKK